jgi:molybdopterin-guanine dinucleotide biosynthesis protein A
MDPSDITGLVLAGGRGSRMGGVDKGLQTLHGLPLAQHALQRLAPQVGAMMVNANRHLDRYAEFGAPVWPDEPADYAGPLAGFLAGLTHAQTPWVATVPCDTPHFPVDLVARLGQGLGSAPIAVAATLEDGRVQRQPVFCLMKQSLQADLAAFVADGGRKIEHWIDRHGAVNVVFADANAFFNANTADELRRLDTA